LSSSLVARRGCKAQAGAHAQDKVESQWKTCDMATYKHAFRSSTQHFWPESVLTKYPQSKPHLNLSTHSSCYNNLPRHLRGIRS
jgi:hypothetical protein